MSAHYQIDLTNFLGRAALSHTKRGELLDAIDGASDQDRLTWIIAGGKRVAAIVPVGDGEYLEDLSTGRWDEQPGWPQPEREREA